MKKKAFTLAEVLITIGIIGVVAAITIPNLIASYQQKVFVNKLKQTHSIFSQAFKMATEESGPAELWDIDPRITMEGAEKLLNYLKPHIKQLQACGRSHGCFPKTYQTFSGVAYGYNPYNHTMYVRGMLANGVSFALPSSGSGCPDGICAPLYVDLNGESPPNKTGIDYFGFYITTKGIYPMPGTIETGNGYTCKYKGTNAGNGTGCTKWVLIKGNMDYLRRDISEELAKLPDLI